MCDIFACNRISLWSALKVRRVSAALKAERATRDLLERVARQREQRALEPELPHIPGTLRSLPAMDDTNDLTAVARHRYDNPIHI